MTVYYGNHPHEFCFPPFCILSVDRIERAGDNLSATIPLCYATILCFVLLCVCNFLLLPRKCCVPTLILCTLVQGTCWLHACIIQYLYRNRNRGDRGVEKSPSQTRWKYFIYLHIYLKYSPAFGNIII